ncbi:MAG: YihY/virulence factor BrkB family protein [Kofleriaceae bacterium]|nr:YihY/virulence factor BrkB family protein [Kofleriaceae bacterium]
MHIRAFVRTVGRELIEEDIADLGAMLAYYAVLALFPMLVFVLSLSMLVVDPDTVREGIHLATEAMPATAREVIVARVESLLASNTAGFAIAGAAFALWGASRGATGLMTALNRIHNLRETRSWVRRQLIAIAVTLGVAVLGVIALAMLVLGPLVGDFIAARSNLGDAFAIAWGIARWVGAGLLVLVVWAIIYRFLPDTRERFHLFTPGALAGVLAWLGISALFGRYLGHFNRYEAIYGALGGAIIFLTWLWLSSMALLFGAEINDVLRRSRTAPTPNDGASILLRST